ncbi:S-layer homology domain-containing protein [Paenibacillus harenae]|uniref:S-layer homology domain-containing protein n=1 Tax=Paenibacillus harenae TaxID=306543 RepID=UPI00146CFD2E|nr:S-layer homology domain-containing protein [Paenibacillus harenae]
MKKIGTAFLLAALLIGSQQALAAAAFADTTTHWAKAPIEAAVNQGWINGYDSKTFKPNAEITRAEFLKSLVAAKKYTLTDADTPFTDDKGWFRTYIATGLKQSVIKVGEYKDNLFDPNAKITREEIARMTVRAMGKEKEGAAWGYLAVAKQVGIMQGYEDGSMGGERNATRAEAVVMITNSLVEKEAPQPVAYPKTKEQLNELVQSLPSFKGTTTYGHNGIVLINAKGSDNYFDNTIAIEYSIDLKVTKIIVSEPTAENKTLIKELLKNYYENSFDKAYASYIKVDGLKFIEGKNSINTKYDGRTFEAYKANDNKGVVIWIGE